MTTKKNQTIYIRVKSPPNTNSEIVTIEEDGQSILFHSLKPKKLNFLKHEISSYSFKFPSVLQDISQETIFNITTKSLIDQLLQSQSSTVVSYGGSQHGKTFTLNGPAYDYMQRGLIPRSIGYLFSKLTGDDIQVRVSYIEFNNEIIIDLLRAFNGQPQVDYVIYEGKGGKVGVKNLMVPLVPNEQAAYERFFAGKTQIHQTTIFTIYLDTDPHRQGDQIHSKIHFVDLATPVKPSKEDFSKQSSFNKAMTVLERVLIAEEHIPYRSIPLTHFLMDSLPTRVIIAHVDFNDLHSSLSTLKFASRIQGEVSDDILKLAERKSSQINRLKKEVDDIRTQLKKQSPTINFTEPTREEIQALSEQVYSFLSDATPQFPMKSLYEIKAALKLMKDIYKAQRVSVEEQLREKYVFSVKKAENAVVEEHVSTQEEPVADGFTCFPLIPTEQELFFIFKSTNGESIAREITQKESQFHEASAQKTQFGMIVNNRKEEIDELTEKKDHLLEKKPFPVGGKQVIFEEELEIQKQLDLAKKEYKENFDQFCYFKDKQEELYEEIMNLENLLKSEFFDWIQQRESGRTVTLQDEEEDTKELLDKEERRQKREYKKAIAMDAKSGPYFYAMWKIQQILAREFRPNGTRRFPVNE